MPSPDLDALMDEASQSAAEDASPEQTARRQGVLSRLRRHTGGFLAGVLFAWTATMAAVYGDQVQQKASTSMERVAELISSEAPDHPPPVAVQDGGLANPALPDADREGHKVRRLGRLVHDLEEESPTFALYMDAIRDSDKSLWFYTEEGYRQELSAAGQETDGLDGSVGRASMPEGGRVVTVSIDLNHFDAEYREALRAFPEFSEDLRMLHDRAIQQTIGHEIGHALSMALTDGRSHCADPTDDNPTEGCSLRRENQIGREIGLPDDPRYGAEQAHDLLAMYLLHTNQHDRLDQLLERVDELDLTFTDARPAVNEYRRGVEVTVTAVDQHDPVPSRTPSDSAPSAPTR